MPFVLNPYPAKIGKKIQLFLLQDLNIGQKKYQRYLSKGRIFNSEHIPYQFSDTIKEPYIYMAEFQGTTRGLTPLLDFNDFAIFNKPSGLMVHPISKKTPYSLLDEIRYQFGNHANLAHRIDAQTSGLIIATKQTKCEKAFQTMFENKTIQKTYLALVRGHIKTPQTINKALKKEKGNIGVKMMVSNDGKPSITQVLPLKYNPNTHQTLIQAKPITGRQHQIRIHLHSIGHTLIGDPIYGVSESIADQYLRGHLSSSLYIEHTGASRLCLHASELKFDYHNRHYDIHHPYDFNQHITFK